MPRCCDVPKCDWCWLKNKTNRRWICFRLNCISNIIMHINSAFVHIQNYFIYLYRWIYKCRYDMNSYFFYTCICMQYTRIIYQAANSVMQQHLSAYLIIICSITIRYTCAFAMYLYSVHSTNIIRPIGLYIYRIYDNFGSCSASTSKILWI